MSDPGHDGKPVLREAEDTSATPGAAVGEQGAASAEKLPPRVPDLGAGPANDLGLALAAPENGIAEDDSTAPLELAVEGDDTLTEPGAAPLIVSVVGRTDVGLVRDHNEDNYVVADLRTGIRDPLSEQVVSCMGVLFGVCDGMGGAAAGEVASQMAVDTVLEAMRESVPAADRDGFAYALVQAIERAGSQIFQSATDDRTRRGMGTTSTIAALMDKMLFVGQVGDSRAYVLRRGELKQLTKDQSLVNQLIEAGQLTEAEAEAFEHSNIILQALGTTDQVSVDLTFLELRRGDRLMVCSDGLSGLVHVDVMRDAMAELADLDACCDRLIELAKAGGGHDNVTVIVVDFAGEGLDEPAEGDLAGYQQYPLPILETAENPPEEANTGGTSPPGVPGQGASNNLESEGAISGRYLLIALLLVALAVGVYYWKMGGPAQQETGVGLEPIASQVVVEPEPVEVVVRTDVEGSDLHVDGTSYGAAQGDRWQLDLPPGPHRLEARSEGNVVASSLVTLREGIPATVFLSMPELAGDEATPGAPDIHSGIGEARLRPVTQVETAPGAETAPGKDPNGHSKTRHHRGTGKREQAPPPGADPSGSVEP